MSDIELNYDDLQGLYGDKLYVLPEDPGVSQPSPKPPMEEKSEAKEPVSKVAATEQSEPQEVDPPQQVQPKVPAKPANDGLNEAGQITWRPKPTSKVLFILHQEELRNKELTELLKKIVQSIEIPFESAGFGIVKGLPELKQFHGMPNPFGVVFDHVLNPSGDNPVEVEGGRLYFTHKLDELKDNRDYKRALWEFLKEIKSSIA